MLSIGHLRPRSCLSLNPKDLDPFQHAGVLSGSYESRFRCGLSRPSLYRDPSSRELCRWGSTSISVDVPKCETLSADFDGSNRGPASHGVPPGLAFAPASRH